MYIFQLQVQSFQLLMQWQLNLHVMLGMLPSSFPYIYIILEYNSTIEVIATILNLQNNYKFYYNNNISIIPFTFKVNPWK
jgi:hypothetical protein